MSTRGHAISLRFAATTHLPRPRRRAISNLMSVTPKLGAIAVVIHDGRALLVQRRNPPGAGLWGFPGGHVEPGETALKAAARELLEETGVTAEPQRYIDNFDVIVRNDRGELTHHFLLAATLCRYISGTPQAADDAMAAEWVALEDIPNRPLNDGVQAVLQAGLDALAD